MVQVCTLQIHHSAFFSSTQRNTLSKLNLHKQQGKQTRDRKKKDFFADTKQQARNNIKNGKA